MILVAFLDQNNQRYNLVFIIHPIEDRLNLFFMAQTSNPLLMPPTLTLSSALINDMYAWILLAVAIALAENDPSSLASLWVLLSSAAFVIICILFVRPAISWMIRRTPEEESFTISPPSELPATPVIVPNSVHDGHNHDAIGAHSVFRAFVFGLITPNGSLGVTLLEKLEDFESGLLLPLLYAGSGLKTDVTSIQEGRHGGLCLIEMIVLNVGKDQQLLDDEAFPIMVIVALVMTAIISPIVAVIYRPTRRPTLNQTQVQSDHIIHAFENFEQSSSFISVQPLTAISPYFSMHEDICGLAEDKHVALVIIPFHKQQTVDGGMEVANPTFRTVNQNLLANVPCSVGILVDRGLSTLARVRFTVLRFIAGEESLSATMQPPSLTSNQIDPPMLTVEIDIANEKQLDDNYLNDFRMKNANNEMVVYNEQFVNNGEKTVSFIRSLDIHQDLFIVGRGQGMTFPITDGLTNWSECPELGVIEDILSSSDFASTISAGDPTIC
ncbi:Cation/H(+) antiporter 15 [Hibiscus syriacus]|uniref:Cation/H(+) antiporter 15 n=1 Tax=Hibiscus syriacus TaxID=106335 RepID=A0A6A2Y281_HIBSY|nr:Cation/H(+) antiporter 15 [Hibiscus syriacus]